MLGVGHSRFTIFMRLHCTTAKICNLPGPKIGTGGTQIVAIKIPNQAGMILEAQSCPSTTSHELKARS
jgi:hypothetical protein